MTQKPLILHFDINGTVTICDSTEEIIGKPMYNIVLAKSTYGKLINDIWSLSSTPFTKTHDTITYYQYLRKKVTNHKELACLFTNEGNPGYELKHYVEKMGKMYEHSFLFPSFINVVNKFKDAKLVFRTFGPDGEMVIKEMKEIYGYNKPFTYGTLDYKDSKPILSMSDGCVLNGWAEVNNYICSNQSMNLMIKDNYSYWNNNNKLKQFGKPLILSNSVTQLFFDDNDLITCHDTTGTLINNYEGAFFINTIDALLNESYYLDQINHNFSYLTK